MMGDGIGFQRVECLLHGVNSRRMMAHAAPLPAAPHQGIRHSRSMEADLLVESLGDVQETLDAAFALIDAYLPSPRSRSGSESWGTPPNSSEWLSPSVVEAPSTAPSARDERKPGTRKCRQKEQIARLRGEAAELEAQLDLIRAGKKKRLVLASSSEGRIREIHTTPGVEAVSKVTRAGRPVGAVSLWRDVAARQKLLRRNSEAENNRLRHLLSEQCKTIRSIKRLLIRETERHLSPHQRINLDPQLGGMDSQLMEHLHADLNTIYESVDDTFQRCGLSSASVVPMQHHFFRLAPTKFVALIMETRVMPFSYRQTADAMWGLTLGVCSGSMGDFGLKSSAIFGDTVFRSYTVDISKNDSGFASAGDHAMRKYIEDNRVVFVNNGRGLPRVVSGRDVGDIACREVGRMVISPVTNQLKGNTGLCCLQSCMEIIADVANESEEEASCALEFLKALVEHKVDTFDQFSGTLESILLRHQPLV